MSALVTPEYIADFAVTGTANNTTLNGAYTAASGSMTVTSAAALSTTNQFHFYIADQTTLAVKCIGKATAVSSNTFTVTMSLDANANSGDLVYISLCAGAFRQLQADAMQYGTFANLPTTVPPAGASYKQTDGPYLWISNGSVWQAFLNGYPVTLPPSAATFSTTLGTGTLAASSDATSLLMEGTQSLYGYYIKTPTYSVPYSVQAAFVLVWGCSSNALIVHSDGTKIMQWGFNYGDFGIATQAMNSATSFNSNPYDPGNFYPAGSLIFLKISLTSSHRTYYIGDGIDWVQTYQESNTFFLTTSKVGIGAYGGSASVGAVVKCVHYLETTP